MNRVDLYGNLTRDVEMRYTPSGVAVASFGLAVNRRYRQDDEVKQDTTYVDLTAFGRTAEVAGEFLAKGRALLVEGHLRYNAWESEGGAKRSKLDVVVDRLHLLPRGGGNGSGNGAKSFEGTVPEDAEVPF